MQESFKANPLQYDSKKVSFHSKLVFLDSLYSGKQIKMHIFVQFYHDFHLLGVEGKTNSQILQQPTSTPPTHTPYLICFNSVLMNNLTSGVFTHLFLQSNKAK